MSNGKRKFDNSDIRYADRLLMKKYQTIAEHRNDAARTAMKLACVALNDTEGLGFKRLVKFAQHHQELVNEFYQDPEMGEAHLNHRLQQLGFAVSDNGHLYGASDETGKSVRIRLIGEDD